jgi:hypothetical protein
MDTRVQDRPPRPGPQQRSLPARILGAWPRLAPQERLAATAALGLLVTMFLPWYQLQSLNRKTGQITARDISAFGDVSFVEAAVFLVAAGVLVLLFARAERRAFHLPGGDGTVIMAAGIWAAFLIFYRVFSRPDGGGYPVGIQWGFFLAFVAAGSLAAAGWRLRAAHVPEPPGADGSPPRRRPPPAPPRHEPPDTAPTAVARRRPGAEPVAGQLSFDEDAGRRSSNSA